VKIGENQLDLSMLLHQERENRLCFNVHKPTTYSRSMPALQQQQEAQDV